MPKADLISIPRRRVVEMLPEGKFYVQQQMSTGEWQDLLRKPFARKASAYAALGRIVADESTKL